jgi:hypothetical protein
MMIIRQKRRWLRALQIAVIVGSLSWVGYSVSTDVRALGSGNTAISEGKTFEEQYPELPPEVAKSIQSVVALQRLAAGKDSDIGMVASGVILNDHQVLTAGHATDTGSEVLSCNNISIDAPGFLTPASASRIAATYGSAMHSNNTDLAMLSIKSDANFKRLPAVSIASDPPSAGDTVFFINYQPKADGQLRSPMNAGASDPVIFSGIVLGSTPHGLAIATGGGESFGHGDPDNLLRKGASGGAVVNAKGELVGLSVSSDSLQAKRSAEYIAYQYNVQLPKQLYQIANAQTLNTQNLTELQSDMATCAK